MISGRSVANSAAPWGALRRHADDGGISSWGHRVLPLHGQRDRGGRRQESWATISGLRIECPTTGSCNESGFRRHADKKEPSRIDWGSCFKDRNNGFRQPSAGTA